MVCWGRGRVPALGGRRLQQRGLGRHAAGRTSWRGRDRRWPFVHPDRVRERDRRGDQRVRAARRNPPRARELRSDPGRPHPLGLGHLRSRRQSPRHDRQTFRVSHPRRDDSRRRFCGPPLRRPGHREERERRTDEERGLPLRDGGGRCCAVRLGAPQGSALRRRRRRRPQSGIAHGHPRRAEAADRRLHLARGGGPPDQQGAARTARAEAHAHTAHGARRSPRQDGEKESSRGHSRRLSTSSCPSTSSPTSSRG